MESAKVFELDELVLVYDGIVSAPRSEIPGTYPRHGVEAARDMLLEILSAHGTRWELRIGGVSVLKPSALIERVRFRKREDFAIGPTTSIRQSDPTLPFFSDGQRLDDPPAPQEQKSPGYVCPPSPAEIRDNASKALALDLNQAAR